MKPSSARQDNETLFFPPDGTYNELCSSLTMTRQINKKLLDVNKISLSVVTRCRLIERRGDKSVREREYESVPEKVGG